MVSLASIKYIPDGFKEDLVVAYDFFSFFNKLIS